MNLEGLEEDAEALLHHRDDGTVEMRKWITEVPAPCLPGSAQAYKGRLENEGRSKQKQWSQILEDHVARNDFMRHVVGEVDERGAITRHVCEHCRRCLVEDFLW